MCASIWKKRVLMTVAIVLTCAVVGSLCVNSTTMAADHSKLALDANGGGGYPYLNDKLTPNDNLLWKIVKSDDTYVRIIPKVNENTALDANGGVEMPYLNPNTAENDNLLWKFEQHGEYVMIIPKVNEKSVLDANDGKDNPFLSPEPDADNINHQWLLVKEEKSEYYRIYSKSEKK